MFEWANLYNVHLCETLFLDSGAHRLRLFIILKIN